MTPETAASLYQLLLDLFKKYGFECIGTFSLRTSYEEEQFDSIKASYRYEDTETAFAAFERDTESDTDALWKLQQLVEAASEFFQISTQMPDKYREIMANLAPEKYVPEINMAGLDNESVNLEDILGNAKGARLVKMLMAIRQNLEGPDEQLESILNKL